MIIQQTKNQDLIKSIVTNPILYRMANFSIPSKRYKPYMGHIWIEVKEEEDKAIGLFELRRVTSNTYEAHPYILPEYQNTPISKIAGLETLNFIKHRTKIENIVLSIPEHCVHAIKYALKLNFDLCGMIKNGAVYHKQKQNLMLFQLEV